MQIFEITKLGKQRTDEGLLDSFKAEVGLDPSKPDSRTFMQKIKGEIPRATDKTTPEYQRYQASLDARTRELEKSFTDKGYDVSGKSTQSNTKTGSELDKVIQQVQGNPQLQQTINSLDDDFAQAMPGYELKVHSDKTNGDYYKDEKGNWWNDNFPRQRLSDPASIDSLEQLANQGKAKEQPSPATIAARQAQELASQKKGGKKPEPVAEAKGDRKIKNTFFGWIRPKIEKIKDQNGSVISLIDAMNKTPALKTKLTTTFKQMLAANDQGNQEQVKQSFKDFVTIAIAGLINERNRVAKEQGGQSTTDDENELDLATGDVDADKLAKEISPQGLKLLSRMPQEEVVPAIEKVVNAAKKQL